ncbi:MAG: Ig-like domain-containing protein [Prevotellaceae bacterium]|jgi:hypothetical protein|nr:Ig-like domain-containing protein [Prevotellaceae bacterium]
MKKTFKKAGGICLLFFGVLCIGCTDEPIEPVVVAQVVVSETVVTLNPGETVQLTATVTPNNAGNKTVFWKSMNDRIATVDNGLIRAEAPGTVTIVALAYSNTEARSEVTVTVTGVPEDLATAVAGTYIGNVTMSGMPIATDVEATLTAAGNKVRLATEAVTGMGTLTMDIEVDVQREGDGYRISGSGVSSFNAVSVDGTIDAEGNMELTINLTDEGIVVVFTARRGQTLVQAVAGTYMGVVSIPMMGDLPDIELTLTPDGATVKLTANVEVPGVGTLVLDIPMTVTRAGLDYTVFGTGTTDLFGPVSVNGTVSAGGAINLTIHVVTLDMNVTYTGQRLEDVAAIVAGTYIGTVSAQGMGAITGNDVEMVLTSVNRTTVHWATQTDTDLGVSFNVSDFALTVTRSGSDFTIAGSGDTSVGPLEVTGTIDAAGHVLVSMTGPSLPVTIIYEGQKQ